MDRSQDPDGSWWGDADQYLDPDQHTQAREVIAEVRETEKDSTKDMRAVERENGSGARLAGLEFRLKGEDRLKEKLADLMNLSAPDATPAELVRGIPDTIRYTFYTNAETYSDAYSDIKERLEALGYEMRYSENYWSDSQYKGINTRWVTSTGWQFEVQFHTPESLHAKQHLTHAAYERLRSPLTSDEERIELRAFQEDVCSWIPVPEGATEIPNYRKEGR